MMIGKGPWFSDMKLIIINKLTRSMSAERDLSVSMPIRVRLPTLSFKLWGPRATSALLSSIRKPVKVDEPTQNKSKISFVRVLVEVRARFGFPSMVKAEDDIENIYTQEIIYGNPPPLCDNRLCFGHLKSQFHMSKVWVPKENKNDDIFKEHVTIKEVVTTTEQSKVNLNLGGDPVLTPNKLHSKGTTSSPEETWNGSKSYSREAKDREKSIENILIFWSILILRCKRLSSAILIVVIMCMIIITRKCMRIVVR